MEATFNVVIVRRDATTVTFQANGYKAAAIEVARMANDSFWRLDNSNLVFLGNDEIGLLAPWTVRQLKREAAAAHCQLPHTTEPVELFDGYAVYRALDERARQRTSAENVSDVLDAVVRLMRAAPSQGA